MVIVLVPPIALFYLSNCKAKVQLSEESSYSNKLLWSLTTNTAIAALSSISH
ncbi:MAG: hypothetical protein QNJ70_00210 [Xenococcaceae cyanobacterium MO_207.B15]|nr:hypothetical protein [Xenococcaceae cyanobacterium MO_207.B15]